MKTINNYITEKLKINKSKLSSDPQYTLFPQNRDELLEMIKAEIKQNGYECSLNHIDVSEITDMSQLFSTSGLKLFDGDISEWDVSNVTDMSWMFSYSKFNNDISKWKINPNCDTEAMFFTCINKDEYKPFQNGKKL